MKGLEWLLELSAKEGCKIKNIVSREDGVYIEYSSKEDSDKMKRLAYLHDVESERLNRSVEGESEWVR